MPVTPAPRTGAEVGILRSGHRVETMAGQPAKARPAPLHSTSRACSRVIISCHPGELTLPCKVQPRLLESPRRCALRQGFPPETAPAAPTTWAGVVRAFPP